LLHFLFLFSSDVFWIIFHSLVYRLHTPFLFFVLPLKLLRAALSTINSVASGAKQHGNLRLTPATPPFDRLLFFSILNPSD
jgi:hypothetical protein